MPGAGGGPQPGSGRPRDEVRAQLLHLSAGKGLPFLSDVLDGKIRVDLIGVCAQCKAETTMDMDWVESFVKQYMASADLRLRANEQALKYGLGQQKEVSAENVRERVANTLAVIRAHTSPEQAATIVNALRPVWV